MSVDYTTTQTKPSTMNEFPSVFNLIQGDLLRREQTIPVFLVREDMESRHQYGLKKYGEEMQPFDGNDMLREAYQEAIDMVVYWRQLILERDHSTDPNVWQLVRSLLAYVPKDTEDYCRAVDWLRQSGSSDLCEVKGV